MIDENKLLEKAEKDIRVGRYSLLAFMEIVNQLAEEHNNGFCEWVVKDYGGTKILREPHRMYLFKASEDEWEYCPYCGKKIKVAPYQPKGE